MYIIFKELIILILCHLVGDYVLQNDFIAKSKGENRYHLFVHCMLYILPFFLCFGLSWQIIFIFFGHYIIDTMKARFHKINYRTDQLLHYLLLILYFV